MSEGRPEGGLSPYQRRVMSVLNSLLIVAACLFILGPLQWGTKWGGRTLTITLLGLVVVAIVAALICGRALSKSGAPFDRLRWYWPWGHQE